MLINERDDQQKYKKKIKPPLLLFSVNAKSWKVYRWD